MPKQLQNQDLTVNVPFGHTQGKEQKELDFGSDEPEIETPLPLTSTSRLLYMLGDIAAGPAFRFTQWLELVRKRSAKIGSSGFPRRHLGPESTMPPSIGESIENTKCDPPQEQITEISLWERLGKASTMEIESSTFSWDRLTSLHHTEHGGTAEQSEDEMNKVLEVTVNSGGVVFFAFFSCLGSDITPKEAAAVIKISSSRMATQSERLGYEFAKWLGVRAPQARVIHNTNQEWLQIKEAAEKARDEANREGDEVGEITCSELLEALELSRCLFFMSYVHGSPLLENSSTFESQESAEKIAAALGRVLMLDLVIRNEDRLPCRELRWRGNFANLLFAEKMTSVDMDALAGALDSAVARYRPQVVKALQRERRKTSFDSRMSPHDSGLISQTSDLSDITESPKSSDISCLSLASNESTDVDFPIVAIDSGVPRRPPAGKRTNDQSSYPKLVELLLNNSEFSSNILYDITSGKLGSPPPEETNAGNLCVVEMSSVVYKFGSGFRAALRDLQGFHIFLLTLHQRLDSLLREFMSIISQITGEPEKEDPVVTESPSHAAVGIHCPSPTVEWYGKISQPDFSDAESQRTAEKSSPSPSLSLNKEISDSNSPISRERWHGKFYRGREAIGSLRLTAKLRDFHKLAKVDVESNKELEQWNEMLKSEAVKICQENNFNSGFFEGDNNGVFDAYELKVRLEHILERIALISEAVNTERPSFVLNNMFIGGALAARSIYTLQHLGITNILCLCSNEIGQSDSQFPDLFVYKNFSICDSEETDISSIFEEACNFIDCIEQINGRVLVHCFEGRSRSATLVLAYLMLRKNFTLSDAWSTLKRAHRKAQPNDGFAKILLRLDRKLHGKVSMEWQQRKPTMKVCPVCGKDAGLSSSSLKLHLQKAHKKLSSGSVDSAMTMEIEKALTSLKVNRAGSVNPHKRQSNTGMDE